MSVGHSMSDDSATHADGPQTLHQPSPQTGNAGAALRAARENAGLHIGALAVSLKVPVKKLEALESGDLEQLPDAVFARALAASVCRTLKIDPEPVLALLPQIETPPLQVGSRISGARIDASGSASALPALSRLPRPVLYVTAGLLLAAVLVWVLPAIRSDAPVTVAAPDGMAVRAVPNLASTAAPAVPEPPVSAPQAAASQASLPSPMASMALAAPAAVAASAAIADARTSDSGAIVVLSARAQAWVQVVGADGVVHLRKTMSEGETARISGALPLSVVVGRANAIEVQVRGKPFDLAELSRDNVARFQIK